MSSWQKTLLIGLALAGLIGVAILVVIPPLLRNSCEGIFQQTAPKMEAHLQIIKDKGARVGISQEKILELSDSAQKVGLHLKACCTVLDGGKLDANEFQQCIDRASAYEKQTALVAQQVTEVAEAKEKGAAGVPPEKIGRINQAIESATSEEKSFARQVAQIVPPVPVPPNGDSSEEKEPNDQITNANMVQLGKRIRGAIASDKDRDYFKFGTSSREPNKTRVIVRKLSTGGFSAEVNVYDQVESHVKGLYDWGGDHPLSLAFESTPNSDYYILVKSHRSGDQGPYELEVREE